jgi:hypothetical protein
MNHAFILYIAAPYMHIRGVDRGGLVGAKAPPKRGMGARRQGRIQGNRGFGGAVGGVWLVFEEVYGVKWKKCEKLVKKGRQNFWERKGGGPRTSPAPPEVS